MSSAAFTHDTLASSEPRWLLSPRWDDVADLTTDALVDTTRVVVLAAHPDDETLGVGGLMHDLVAAGHDIAVVVASDGEASHPQSHVTEQWLARTRREECRSGLARLGVSEVVFLGVPDGQVGVPGQDLVDLVSPHLDADTTLFAPWTSDGHPDHERLGEAAATAAQQVGARAWFYPIWLWHWADEAGVPWDRVVTYSPAPTALHAKEAAISCHRSQVEALGPDEGDAPVLTAAGLGPSRRLVETLIRGGRTGRSAHPAGVLLSRGHVFDAMFEADDDPWGFETSWFEARKRSLTLAVLGRARYDAVLDIGCSSGVLTAELAARADHVTAVDASAAALRRAGTRLRDHEHVELVHGSTGSDLPRASYDLVVLSEVGYFLTGAELLAMLRWARGVLAPQGEVLLCHWRRPTRDVPLDGPLVHRQARAALDLPLVSSYADDDVVLDVWSAADSPATREGIA
ncbi:MAG: bifunctional PIG-L family deacetylase/class I SAM-dependent methyltransferase [Nocardioides sp.]|nr:bifunctional PIG-L family deacetylase/class I SAM-dependent methyltransferase [Nocardioides sp.]